MAEYNPIVTVEDLDKINQQECVEGYMFARSDKALNPDFNIYSCTRSFYHGYLNGLVDTKKIALSEAQRQLAKDLRKHNRIEGIWDLMDDFVKHIVDPENPENRPVQ